MNVMGPSDNFLKFISKVDFKMIVCSIRALISNNKKKYNFKLKEKKTKVNYSLVGI